MAEVLTPTSSEGRALSPVEAKTGVVLPIWASGDGITNRHHAHFYRRNYMNGPRKIETRAVRISRLQRVPMEFHNGSPRAYHSHFDGTELPDSERRSFGITVLNYAGYIPSYVIDMTGAGPQVSEITPQMKETLSRPGVFTVENGRRTRRHIGQFLMRYASRQDFKHVKERHIEQFLELGKQKHLTNETAQEKRLELGMKLANIGLGIAVDGINKTYLRARDNRAMSVEAPVCAWKVAKDIVEGFEQDYFDDIEQNLMSQFAM